jgi:hypothetical protein
VHFTRLAAHKFTTDISATQLHIKGQASQIIGFASLPGRHALEAAALSRLPRFLIFFLLVLRRTLYPQSLFPIAFLSTQRVNISSTNLINQRSQSAILAVTLEQHPRLTIHTYHQPSCHYNVFGMNRPQQKPLPHRLM